MLERIMPNSHGALRRAVHRRLRFSPGRVKKKTDWRLTVDSFEKFLGWLSPDREEAGKKYEQIRKQLVRLFIRRGCHIPEELFDRTIDRVCKKLEPGPAASSGDPVAFCYAVAGFVLKEYWREPNPGPISGDVLSPVANEPDWDEQELQCLDTCLSGLSAKDRDLITRYYQGEGHERIQRRKDLASEVGGMNALRIQVFRIRAQLRQWFSERVRQQKPE